MTYASVNFFAFVALTVLAYFALPLKKQKWVVLLIASYIFYLFAGYKYVAFILFTTVSTYFISRWIDRLSRQSKEMLKTNKTEWNRETKKQFKEKVKRNKRLVMALALILNFGILAFLKYYNFFAGSLNDVFGAIGMSFSMPTLKLFLPLGISFYTFQSMGYVVDVYREKFPAEKNIVKFALFVSFFPQIIQGPISFYDQLAHQLYEPHKVDFTRIKYGCELILWGFFKKLVIADRAVIAINTVVADYNKYNGTTLTFTVLLYALQLYADFSGGIDISRGIAQILGIDMVENFKRPYFSKSINEYWRRWHITLGAWMKEYVFYPLSLSGTFLSASKKMKASRFGKTKAGSHIAKVLPTAIASLIVFLIVGIWHGSSWKYVAFGLWNGGIIMLSILLKPVFDICNKKLHINPNNFFWKLFQMLRTFIVVCIGYVFDVAPSFKQATHSFFKIMFCFNIEQLKDNVFRLGLEAKDFFILLFASIVLFLASLIQEKAENVSIRVRINKTSFMVQWIIIFVAVMIVLMFGVYGSNVHNGDFVYAQF